MPETNVQISPDGERQRADARAKDRRRVRAPWVIAIVHIFRDLIVIQLSNSSFKGGNDVTSMVAAMFIRVFNVRWQSATAVGSREKRTSGW